MNATHPRKATTGNKTVEGISPRRTPGALWLVLLLGTVCLPQLAAADPLHTAVKTRNKQEVQRLIDTGADINAKDSGGFTPLMFAAQLGDYAIAELLVARGAKLNEANTFNATALHKALDAVRPRPGNQLDSVRRRLALLLIESGADVKFVGYNRTTPLHLASMWGDLAVIEALIQKGAQVNARTQKGFTPLVGPQALGRKQAVALLKQNGAR